MHIHVHITHTYIYTHMHKNICISFTLLNSFSKVSFLKARKNVASDFFSSEEERR